MPKFSKKEALGNGWKIFKKNWLFLLAVTLISLAVGYAPTLISTVYGQQYPVAVALVSLVLWVVGILVSIGLIKIALALVDGREAAFADLINGEKFFIKFILAGIVVGVVVIIGLLLLVIPGIIFGIRLQFAPYFVVDQGAGPIAAAQKSWAATRGSAVNLILFDILLGLVTFLGVLALGIGILIALPVTMLATAWVFRKLASAASL